MRQYEPIWLKLKSLPLHEAKAKGVSVTANRVLHKRIIKAVKKEKWLDLPYKFAMDPQKMVLSFSRNGAILTFYLDVAPHTISSTCL